MSDRKHTILLVGALLIAASPLTLSGLLAHAEPLAPPAAYTRPLIAGEQLPALTRAGQPLADAEEARTAPLDQVMPLDPSIIIGELDNGLRYYIRQNRWPEKRAELRLVVRAGSLLEDDDQLGLAHFVEHMAFNGTEHFAKQELVKTLESFGMRFGADINATTSFDETIYMLRIPTDSGDIISTAFQVLEDWAHGVSFDDLEIDKERGVVIEERRLGLGAGTRLRDKQFPVLFRGSRYAERSPIGTLESLQDFDHQAVRRFYREWYRPDLLGVIAVGDFDKADIEVRIRRHFEDVPMPPDPRPREVFDIPDHQETLFAIATDPEATGSSVAVFHKLPLRDQGTIGAYRQSLVENLYNSMLNRRLTEQSQQPNPPFLGASSQQGIFIPTKEVYVLGAAVRDGGIERGLEALLRESDRVARSGFTKSELEREERQVLRAFERIYTEKATQNSVLFAEEFQRAFLEGESVPGIDYEWALYQRFMPEITLQEVNRVGKRWLRDQNRVVVVTAPEKEDLSVPSEQQLLAVLGRVDKEPMEAYVDTTTDAPLLSRLPEPGEIVSTSTIDELDVTEWQLSNGVRVVLKPTDFREDQVLFRAISPGGASLASDEDYVAASSAVQVISASGFGQFSARQLTNMLADKVVRVSPVIGSLEEGFRGSASPRDLETLFQLIYLKFTAPRADAGVFKLITRQIRESLADRNVTPEAAFRETLQRTLTQDNYRRRPVSVELIDEMNLSASYAFYKDRFADASDFTFVFVGHFQVDAVRPLVLRYLGGLPSIGRQESWRDEGVRPPTGVIHKTVRKGLEPKSLTSIVFTGPFEYNRPHREAIGAMAAVLQERLREVLREDLGGTYSVQVRESSARVPHPEYSVTISFGSDPQRVEELTAEIVEQIEKLKAEPPARQEVDNVKASQRRQFETARKQNGFWLAQLVATYREGRDPREALSLEESLEQLSPALIQEAARTYLNLDNYVQVSLLPAQ
ncbi:MAG: M16 family metallopeptidase [Acidobacteriota bacterium]